jgi:hypothetical protein
VDYLISFSLYYLLSLLTPYCPSFQVKSVIYVVAQSLKFFDELYILPAKRNSGSFAYYGIELGGERVRTEIEDGSWTPLA